MRDYIGSADAWHIYRENYASLAKSKMKDSSFTNEAMSRGIMLEKDILFQTYKEDDLETQKRICHESMSYCSATLDGYHTKINRILEVKTSIYSMPNIFLLIRKFPQYYVQVQWQIWVMGKNREAGIMSGYKDAEIIWCKCPESYEESPYDENGYLDIDYMIIEPDNQLFDIFEENAPKFWKFWEEYKKEAEKNDENI